MTAAARTRSCAIALPGRRTAQVLVRSRQILLGLFVPGRGCTDCGGEMACGAAKIAHGHEHNTDFIVGMRHIRRDHTARLSITKLARTCRMSRFSFSRLFRKTFGVSCRDYVMRLRIETACTLLEVPGASIADVATTAGFTDASYFARMFRSRMGMSPKEYASRAVAPTGGPPSSRTGGH